MGGGNRLDCNLLQVRTHDALGAEALDADQVDLARRIKQGDQDALHRLTRANLRFVVSVAKTPCVYRCVSSGSARGRQ